jgi:hypothetical protein
MKCLVWVFVVAGLLSAAIYALAQLLTTRSQCGRRTGPNTLKTIAAAQADFLRHDRDANGIQDYWRGDVAGLYSLLPFEDVEPIGLIERSAAEADLAPWPEHALAPAPLPKYAYVFLALRHVGEEETGWNPNRFAAGAFPTVHKADAWPRNSYIISEGNAVFLKDLGPGGRVLTFPADPLKEGWRKVD